LLFPLLFFHALYIAPRLWRSGHRILSVAVIAGYLTTGLYLLSVVSDVACCWFAA
jgi:hypothetical protein